MWRQRDDGTPMLPDGVPDPIPLRSLWGNVVVDCTKKNQEKEVVLASECLTKQSFIQQGIAKYIDVRKSMMARMQCTPKTWQLMFITGNDCIRR